ncbi:GntR family transcriptional regulator [Streptomyces sp. SRF1]|uniref:GntR family transcriptional regulator n=1 Tax=Streptomyces sp. SRF1 TaxID=1549642 RepID=UPI0025AF9D2F|nr:GntR family transcriptional regulator [Streptomyces sp. SRF1]MDN3056150.1 GntR family transcriptional regulator [Streptomyces sp. SRF1]
MGSLSPRGAIGKTSARSRTGGHVPQASPRGTYLQISESLRQKIEKGAISEALPSEAELMRTYGVGRSTVGRALKGLKADGVIKSVQGAGWYVAGMGDRWPLVEKVTDLLRGPDVEVGDPSLSENEHEPAPAGRHEVTRARAGRHPGRYGCRPCVWVRFNKSEVRLPPGLVQRQADCGRQVCITWMRAYGAITLASTARALFGRTGCTTSTTWASSSAWTSARAPTTATG